MKEIGTETTVEQPQYVPKHNAKELAFLNETYPYLTAMSLPQRIECADWLVHEKNKFDKHRPWLRTLKRLTNYDAGYGETNQSPDNLGVLNYSYRYRLVNITGSMVLEPTRTVKETIAEIVFLNFLACVEVELGIYKAA